MNAYVYYNSKQQKLKYYQFGVFCEYYVFPRGSALSGIIWGVSSSLNDSSRSSKKYRLLFLYSSKRETSKWENLSANSETVK